ncbi:hypothetical protein FPOAC2_14618 [Fusarium poae]|uniref:FAD/NAD(P)-binding domain-containing protein n=1 Tax=Fusarium poae TaxID=36050 RepID=A0A1B8A683_FUSPO|nr:uncharacterized protein FPOAC1_013895 [Fusarium poae]XP_044701439.1 uncharacterized protein FPOAC1_012913 [Fusarium poae]KAG8664188.1 hypothetical protein FPOAC1_013895 [Fusarium poae]KAG8664936.1 hypothetical protein FPOAC1_012913 [Fusarium poae]OBS15981.1 hypothetical protein FPOA_13258 [Fusarium poae]
MATLSNRQAKASKFSTDLADHSDSHASKTGPYTDNQELDVLVIGAGFAGVYMLKTLRERGLKTVIFEAGNDLGGTWRWNCYPGAAVDSDVPEYEYSWPEVYNTWSWRTNYPNFQDLRNYFDHVDKVMKIKKDCSFNTRVVGAHFSTDEGKWSVETADGRTTKTKYLVLGTGVFSKRFVPSWPGVDKFKGIIHHSSFWPNEEIDVKGKRCGIIGTGASGVQITQAWGPRAAEVKVFQRTPNLAVPMRRKALPAQGQDKKLYPELFKLRETSFAGFTYDWCERSTFDDSLEEREAFYEKLWQDGGFRFWVANYKDTLLNPKANEEAYRFWAKKTRARINDEKARDLLAPLEMPHYFGVKRPCLEETYYEQFNRDSVHVVDTRNNPLREFTETGITLEDGTHHELEVIAVATGFDVSTGSMTQLGLQSINGTDLEKDWLPGARTYLGTTVPGYPNMFSIYGAQAPTLLSNGPTTVEIQGRWVTDAIIKMERGGVKYIDPKTEAADKWKQRVVDLNNATLFPTTKSTYMGGNVPGKAFEPLAYAAGLPAYKNEIRAALDNWTEGFEVVKI